MVFIIDFSVATSVALLARILRTNETNGDSDDEDWQGDKLDRSFFALASDVLLQPSRQGRGETKAKSLKELVKRQYTAAAAANSFQSTVPGLRRASRAGVVPVVDSDLLWQAIAAVPPQGKTE